MSGKKNDDLAVRCARNAESGPPEESKVSAADSLIEFRHSVRGEARTTNGIRHNSGKTKQMREAADIDKSKMEIVYVTNLTNFRTMPHTMPQMNLSIKFFAV
jgi:hypothetical protein